ncbi:MAG TPA: DUF433 domain-containing protein [Pyrinomonadaceae bacterium]|nr:DUF433 domain-containing protein [Pyrinomonadaceae bacterium]
MTDNTKKAHLDSVVQTSPDILGGTPVFKGTRVPVTTLIDHLAAGDPLERFLDHFPTVTREQAVALLDELKDHFDAAA